MVLVPFLLDVSVHHRVERGIERVNIAKAAASHLVLRPDNRGSGHRLSGQLIRYDFEACFVHWLAPLLMFLR